MISQPLSEETIRLGDIAVSNKRKAPVDEMLDKITEMTRNRGLIDPIRK